jgi:hypothetical protein
MRSTSSTPFRLAQSPIAVSTTATAMPAAPMYTKKRNPGMNARPKKPPDNDIARRDRVANADEHVAVLEELGTSLLAVSLRMALTIPATGTCAAQM